MNDLLRPVLRGKRSRKLVQKVLTVAKKTGTLTPAIPSRWKSVGIRPIPPTKEWSLTEPIGSALARLGVEPEISELWLWAEGLESLGREYPNLMGRLLPPRTLELVRAKRLGAAAALEACAMLRLETALPAFHAALADSHLPLLVQEIAAQRARLLRISDPTQRAALGMLVRKAVDLWLRTGLSEAARDALLTVAALEGGVSLGWLTEILRESSEAEIVEASAHAACSLVVRQESYQVHGRFVEAAQAKTFFETAEFRLNTGNIGSGSIESIELARARLIEALGAFAAWGEKVPEHVAHWFCSGGVVERAAAIRAAAHLAKTFGNAAGADLQQSLNRRDPACTGRFLALSLIGRR